MPDLPPSATIQSVLDSLLKPDEYVSGVYQELRNAKKANPLNQVAVRLGITGRGISPYYRIVLDPKDGEPDTDDRIVGAYYDNHTPLEGSTSSANNESWSTRFMTIDEVESLLRSMRGYSGPSPKS